MLQNTRNKITVHVKIAGPIDGRSVTLSGTVELGQGGTIKQLLKKADALPQAKGHKPFSKAFRQKVSPIVLLNGERIALPEEKDRILKEGDEVSVIVALAGG